MLREKWEAIQRMQDIHQRRKAALIHHKEQYQHSHGADENSAVTKNDKLDEDDIDGNLI